jgi:hypothetical protein
MILAYYSLLLKDDLMLIRAVILTKGIQPKDLDPVKRSYHVEMEICFENKIDLFMTNQLTCYSRV